MKSSVVISNVLLVASLVATCLPGPAAQEPVPLADNDTTSLPVAGKIWRWESLRGPNPVDVATPSRYTLELLEGGRYSIRADCNTGGGSYTLEGERLNLAPGPMTMAACGPDSLDNQFVSLLGSINTVAVDGTGLALELNGEEGSMVFAAMQPISLEDSSWLVRSYNNGKGGVVSVLGGSTLYVVFSDNRVISGSAGCNNFTGGYERDGDALSLGNLASTRKMCADAAIMEQETALLNALSTVGTWEARGERLQLRKPDGALAADLVSAVSGTVTYRTRQALPPNAQIRVTLEDISRMDVASTLVGEQWIAAGGRQVPIPFQITFDPTEIDPRYTYGLRATITVEDTLVFTSTRAYPVITRDSPLYNVEIQVDAVTR